MGLDPLMTAGPWLATCEHSAICDWELMLEDEDTAKIAAVCHVLLRHPTLYYETTGKDPEQMAHTYREYIERLRRYL